MTKENYLQLRNNNHQLLLYEYYKEKFNKDRHSLFLNINDFIRTLQLWGDINFIFRNVCKYYNNKFDIVEVFDKKGNLISSKWIKEMKYKKT